VDAPTPDAWDATLADLAQRRSAARAMGGAERLARRRAAGLLDARARIDALLDPASFVELGTLVGDAPADGIVAGAGTVEGRPVLVGAEDFTVRGGTIGAGSNAKRHRLAELARRDRVPLVMLLEGAGYRQDGAAHGRAPTDLMAQARCSGRVPLVVGIMGPSAGHGALIAPLADYAVMTEAACVFTAGPPVVRASVGEDVTKEALGGPAVAVASGLVHDVVADDDAALATIRRYLGYFPTSAWSYPDRAGTGDTEPRAVPELRALVPRDSRRVYDMRPVIAAIVDGGDALELQRGFGTSVLCVLARLGGDPVAIVANQPRVRAGAIDADGADKAARFIRVADAFHLPLLFLADNPGMLPGTAAERAGVLRSGARMFAAQTGVSTPKLHLTLRKAYGFGSMVMAMVGFDGQSATFAFPGATLGAMGASAAVEATGADAALAARLGDAELEAAYRAAAGLGFDEVVDPSETRTVLLAALRRALSRRQEAAAPVARADIAP
jgi:acetyl-CoA carboxylase carboxyltransferase component